ncbi:MAG: cytochrome b/b6 domain-containing protein [Candidatus Tectomicrobia bacterium]|uniref:Cytochrome b/b6 domain-containing protein n=1 Tax=Tectimicrobiota bacterium TaxID=2528274 RepID=A0A932I240_UNCTE|nr:cytochrome b/b6 domain-containing protein [Candidatus Tectomicrobia bacterium]
MSTEPSAPRPAFRYSAALRVTHWLNVPLLLLMIASGIQIWWAYPAFGPGLPKPEAVYRALAGGDAPVDPGGIMMSGDYREFVQELAGRFGVGEWLAGALRWHFALMWPYTLNGLAFLLLLLLTEEGRHYRVRRGDLAGIGEMIRHPVRTFHDPPGGGKFNPIQKLAYNAVVLAGILSVVTGLAVYKPVQLGFLTQALGGYQASRLLHFLAALFLVLFTAGHLVMVLSHGWRRGLAPMVVGIKAEREEFRERQRVFARRALRALGELAVLAGALWLGSLLADILNWALGGQAHGLPFGALVYLAVRLGPVRARDRRAREARRRRLEVTA